MSLEHMLRDEEEALSVLLQEEENEMKHENFERTKRQAIAVLEWAQRETEKEEARMQETIIILCEDRIIHTELSPFCSDIDCSCHSDKELLEQYIYQPIKAGTMTVIEANRIWRGEQV